MPRALKVYRTPIGFHDAYVAAPTQKAALEAWGSEHNLFARGVAEIVTDPELTREPLANPGTVVKRLRGSADDHFDALPKSRRKTKSAKTPAQPRAERKTAPPAPRPSRAALNKAQDALDAANRRYEEEAAELEKREAALARERNQLQTRHAREQSALERRRDDAKDNYDRALKRWSHQ